MVTHMIHTSYLIVKHKVGLLTLADELGHISKACKMMGVSRDTFYRYRDAVADGGVEALLDQSRRVPNHKNVLIKPLKMPLLSRLFKTPHGQVRISNAFRKKVCLFTPVAFAAFGEEVIWPTSNGD